MTLIKLKPTSQSFIDNTGRDEHCYCIVVVTLQAMRQITTANVSTICKHFTNLRQFAQSERIINELLTVFSRFGFFHPRHQLKASQRFTPVWPFARSLSLSFFLSLPLNIIFSFYLCYDFHRKNTDLDSSQHILQHLKHLLHLISSQPKLCSARTGVAMIEATFSLSQVSVPLK